MEILDIKEGMRVMISRDHPYHYHRRRVAKVINVFPAANTVLVYFGTERGFFEVHPKFLCRPNLIHFTYKYRLGAKLPL